MSRLSGLYAEAVLQGTATFLTASTVETQDVTVPGARQGDFAFVTIEGFDAADAVVTATVTADDTVTISMLADGGGATNVASGKIRIKVVPFEAI